MEEPPTDAGGSPDNEGLPDNEPVGFGDAQAVALENEGSQSLVWQNLAHRWSFFPKKTTRCSLRSH